MPQAEFTKMPQRTVDDGVTEYIIDTSSASRRSCCCAGGDGDAGDGEGGRSCSCCPLVGGVGKNPDGFCCPPCCYRQNCVMMNGVFLCFAVIICISVLAGLALTSGRPHIQTLFFVEGECVTQSSKLTGGDESCSCGGRFCTATFPCLQVIVAYTTADGRRVESLLHEDEHVYTNKPGCSYQPEKCVQSQNTWYVNYYKEKWGTPGLVFPCHHHPTEAGAIRRRTRTVNYTIHMLLWPSVCSGVSLLLCVFVYCHCCPRCYNE